MARCTFYEKTEDGEAEKMVILGGYNRQLLLFSKHELVLNECGLGEEYGGCRLEIMKFWRLWKNYSFRM